MLNVQDSCGLDIDARDIEEAFNRRPFGYRHDLHRLDLFSFQSLRELAAKYREGDHFVAAGASRPGTKFYSVPHGVRTPLEALDELDTGRHRVLLKRPENYDVRFRRLLDRLFAQVMEVRGGLHGQKLVRLESSVLVSSAASITPYHFDPEISFFFQVEGRKEYHLYTPSSVAETDLERFYKMGIVNIGHLDFDRRDPEHEHLFKLSPGWGMHQPENCPHWVETRAERSISYVFSFETDVTRAVGRTRGFNYYQRRLGLRPSAIGSRPALDALKANVMQVTVPIRRGASSVVRKALGR
jgi:hypothetical protein